MEKIITYQTADGKIFYNEQTAKDHEELMAFTDWYDKNPLYSVESDKVFGWLKNNASMILCSLRDPLVKEHTEEALDLINTHDFEDINCEVDYVVVLYNKNSHKNLYTITTYGKAYAILGNAYTDTFDYDFYKRADAVWVFSQANEAYNQIKKVIESGILF